MLSNRTLVQQWLCPYRATHAETELSTKSRIAPDGVHTDVTRPNYAVVAAPTANTNKINEYYAEFYSVVQSCQRRRRRIRGGERLCHVLRSDTAAALDIGACERFWETPCRHKFSPFKHAIARYLRTPHCALRLRGFERTRQILRKGSGCTKRQRQSKFRFGKRMCGATKVSDTLTASTGGAISQLSGVWREGRSTAANRR